MKFLSRIVFIICLFIINFANDAFADNVLPNFSNNIHKIENKSLKNISNDFDNKFKIVLIKNENINIIKDSKNQDNIYNSKIISGYLFLTDFQNKYFCKIKNYYACYISKIFLLKHILITRAP